MDQKIRKSLKYSLLDGMFASIMQGLTETFIVPYALAMKAGAGLIGILSSMPNLAGSLLQVNSAALVERLGSRKALINSAILAHALMWIPMIATPYVFRDNQALYLIVFYTLFISLGALAAPAWSSLMADHVPETERGKVFGWRNRIFGIINVSSVFLGGLILYGIAKKFTFAGFTVIFSIAFVARLISWSFLKKMYEPMLVIRDEHRFTFAAFLKRMKKSNFGRFAIFVAAMNFSVYMASPFFAVYMLRDLKFNYLTYTVITMAATLTSLAMMRMWGRYADHVGNIRILKLCSLLIPFIPLFWLFSHKVPYLIIVQIFAGFFWAGFNLSFTNFIYDAVTPEKRTRCIAYFNVINGIAVFSGAAIGGYLSSILPALNGYKILTLILISCVLRFLVAPFSAFIREVRKVKEVSNLELFYGIIGLRSNLRQGILLQGSKE